MMRVLALVAKQFERASMLAKLSLIFNIALAYVIAILHSNEDSLRKEIIECHARRYDDLNDLMVRLNYLKGKVENDTPNNQLSKEIDSIANEHSKSVIKKP